MDNKRGIRLRYLQIQKGEGREQPYERNNKQQNKELSPFNRKKIFYENEQKQKPLKMYSPLKNQPLQASFETSFSEMQYENLVKSLKEKSIELEKRKQIIKKLKKQNEGLKEQNQNYKNQIYSLRKQLQGKNDSRPFHQKTYQQSRNYENPHFNNNQFQNKFTLNEPYEQFAPEEKTKIKSYSYERQEEIREPKRSFIQGSKHSQQDLSDIVSPLMALNAPPIPKFNEKTSFQKRNKQSTLSAQVYQNYEPESYNNKSYNYGYSYEQNFKKQSQNTSNFDRQKSQKQQFDIEDSKQFKFEDFQFEDYDSFSKNNQGF